MTWETTIAEVILQLDPTSDISQMDVLIPHVRSYYDLRVFSKIDAFNLPRGNICKMMHLLMIRHLDTVRSTVLFIIRYEQLVHWINKYGPYRPAESMEFLKLHLF